MNYNRQRQQAVQLPVEHTVNYFRSHTQAIQLPGGHTVTQPIQHTIQQSTRHTISNVKNQPQGTSVHSRRLSTQPSVNRSSPTVVNQPVNHRATGQQPSQPTINRSNSLPAHRSTPPVMERDPCQQPINHPVPGQQYSQQVNRSIPFPPDDKTSAPHLPVYPQQQQQPTTGSVSGPKKYI
ncbi:unnamed protein product [Mytilus edulis]|uniref:Uncharacterized protein n=1 Tax=Mytilus edulis TaxID=6550 RepID=A0A8S3TCQ1_MYTED|nr:unnamed protein product [Mytilus edulis]